MCGREGTWCAYATGTVAESGVEVAQVYAVRTQPSARAAPLRLTCNRRVTSNVLTTVPVQGLLYSEDVCKRRMLGVVPLSCS